jgi:hypothetical protein
VVAAKGVASVFIGRTGQRTNFARSGDRRPAYLAVSGRRRHVRHPDLDLVRRGRRRVLRPRLQRAAVALVSSGGSSEGRSHSRRRHEEGCRLRASRRCDQRLDRRGVPSKVRAESLLEAHDRRPRAVRNSAGIAPRLTGWLACSSPAAPTASAVPRRSRSSPTGMRSSCTRGPGHELAPWRVLRDDRQAWSSAILAAPSNETRRGPGQLNGSDGRSYP